MLKMALWSQHILSISLEGCDWLCNLILALDTLSMLPSVITIVQFTRNQIGKQSVFCFLLFTLFKNQSSINYKQVKPRVKFLHFQTLQRYVTRWLTNIIRCLNPVFVWKLLPMFDLYVCLIVFIVLTETHPAQGHSPLHKKPGFSQVTLRLTCIFLCFGTSKPSVELNTVWTNSNKYSIFLQKQKQSLSFRLNATRDDKTRTLRFRLCDTVWARLNRTWLIRSST